MIISAVAGGPSPVRMKLLPGGQSTPFTSAVGVTNVSVVMPSVGLSVGVPRTGVSVVPAATVLVTLRVAVFVVVGLFCWAAEGDVGALVLVFVLVFVANVVPEAISLWRCSAVWVALQAV